MKLPKYVVAPSLLDPKQNALDETGGRWVPRSESPINDLFDYIPGPGKTLPLDAGTTVAIGQSLSKVLVLIEENNNTFTFRKVAYSKQLDEQLQSQEQLNIEENARKDRLECEIIAEKKLDAEYTEAKKLLDYFNVRYEAEKGLIRSIKYALTRVGVSFDQRRKVIEIANNFVNSTLEKKAHRQYIIDNKLIGDSSKYDSDKNSFIFNKYVLKYLRDRESHCFRCRRHLVSSFSNECITCGWIKCNCGACGCNYSRIQ